MSPTLGPRPSLRELLACLMRLLLWVAPAGLLIVASLREGGDEARWLVLGVGVQALLVVVVMLARRTWAPSPDSILLVCYLTALAWVWFSTPRRQGDWFLHLVEAVLVVIPLGFVALYTLWQSGAPLYQRASKLARRLAARRRWPAELNACRDLSEVKAFREALQFDAGPALQLLNHPKPEVRVCALAALEFRQVWRAGQAELVLAHLQREEVPEVRAAAVSALANCDDRRAVELIADLLRDPDPGVRRAAADALFWDADRRWSWMRYGVRRALGEPALRHDGSLLREGQRLTPEGVDDLVAWAAEMGVLSLRSAQTLITHFARCLHERPEETLPHLLRLLGDPHAAPMLRIELASLLRQHKALEIPALERLLDTANPTPLRLLAAQTLLERGWHSGSEACLREIAHLPNRELALETAEVVQRHLGVDLGLALGQPLPALNSAKAIDVTRRLMAWAAHQASDDILESSLQV